MSQAIYYQLADLYDVSAIYRHGGSLIFRVKPYVEPQAASEAMRRRLASNGFEAVVSEDPDGVVITVRETPRKKIPWLNIILFLATLATMYYIYPGTPSQKIEFTGSLIAILLFHEFGHYLAGRRRGVFMSLPYFLPAPNLVGTFGAIIKSKSPFINRRDLIEVGAAGPVAGFVVAVVVLIFGLQDAQLIPSGAMSGGLILGDSLLIRLLSWLIIGPIPEGYDFLLSPAAFAGWVGLLVTMINLLPLGQLDGGHIIYGLAGRVQHQIGRFFLVAMVILGFWWQGWWFFGVMVLLFGVSHPPTLNDETPLPMPARILGIVAIIIFAISFIPAPITILME